MGGSTGLGIAKAADHKYPPVGRQWASFSVTDRFKAQAQRINHTTKATKPNSRLQRQTNRHQANKVRARRINRTIKAISQVYLGTLSHPRIY